MKRALIIFAKEPKKGSVKTRLNNLSESKRLNLYKAFLKDTVHSAKQVNCQQRIIAYESRRGAPAYLKKIAPQFRFYKQKGINLGERMYRAFRQAAKTKPCKIVIIGSDSPTLPVSYIEDAFNFLDKHDLALGPSHDGGYYLIGLKKNCFRLFKGIEWSSDKVFRDTLKNARKSKKKVGVLGQWYDVDTPQALRQLKRDLKKKRYKNIAQRTRTCLNA